MIQSSVLWLDSVFQRQHCLHDLTNNNNQVISFFKLAISCVCESFILSLQNDILTTMQMDYTCLEEKKQKVYCKYLIYFVTQENDAKTANMKS